MSAWKGSTALALTLALFLGIAGCGSSLDQDDPFLGTWSLDLTKSKYSPGPPPKAQTLTYEAAGDSVKVTTDAVRSDGSKAVAVYTTARDGKDVPIIGAANADTVAVKRIDASTLERTDKVVGRTTASYKIVVSRDGRTLTVTQTGTNAQGQAINNTTVYVKQ